MGNRPKSVVVFEVVAIVGYAALLLSERLAESWDTFSLAWYSSLIGLAVAVSRFRQSWARLVNTALLIMLLLYATYTVSYLLELRGEPMFWKAAWVMALAILSSMIQLVALWRPATSRWLARDAASTAG